MRVLHNSKKRQFRLKHPLMASDLKQGYSWIVFLSPFSLKEDSSMRNRHLNFVDLTVLMHIAHLKPLWCFMTPGGQ